ncbi:unnamed protein product [Prunus armeniaca]|uniref:Uncharacterized protein n=1 Tax=Prunus armeniaca TaxID=36596 RepID=A0A6J5UT67_PRUAR|nr:unnamed protein product [Prunus armeniaca]
MSVCFGRFVSAPADVSRPRHGLSPNPLTKGEVTSGCKRMWTRVRSSGGTILNAGVMMSPGNQKGWDVSRRVEWEKRGALSTWRDPVVGAKRIQRCAREKLFRAEAGQRKPAIQARPVVGIGAEEEPSVVEVTSSDEGSEEPIVGGDPHAEVGQHEAKVGVEEEAEDPDIARVDLDGVPVRGCPCTHTITRRGNGGRHGADADDA